MSRLSLIWDGQWLMWATGESDEVARREISNPDMVSEVLRALHHQAGSGGEVIYAEWARAATAVPPGILPNAVTMDELAPLHELHHGATKDDTTLHMHVLDEAKDAPWLVVEGEVVWAEAVQGIFPQAKHVPLVHALIHDSVQWHRLTPCQGWSFRVDVRESGAVMVATSGESLQWIHHMSRGISAEDVLYAMVNAAHRGGAELHDCRVRWSGEEVLTSGWARFMEVVSSDNNRNGKSTATWVALFQSLHSCA